MVDRKSPIPAHYQIAVDLAQRISQGEWRAGDKIPSEIELSDTYEVSRMTVRQALHQLSEEGILDRKPGNGTFINQGYLDFMEFSYHKQLRNVIQKGEKDQLRKTVWSTLRKVAKPDSRFHWNFNEFVPDFEGSEKCTAAICQTDVYRQAKSIFIAPDNSLGSLRCQAILDGKILLVATYAICRGFHVFLPGEVPAEKAAWAASLDGMEEYGRPISLEEIVAMGKVDAMITGISLVSEKGTRWGKGHGYFDLEWAIFRDIGVVEEGTPIIAVGHDCQVISTDLKPSDVDTVADLVVTPTRVINVEKTYPKPQGILWDYITPGLLKKIPPLMELHHFQSKSS